MMTHKQTYKNGLASVMRKPKSVKKVGKLGLLRIGADDAGAMASAITGNLQPGTVVKNKRGEVLKIVQNMTTPMSSPQYEVRPVPDDPGFKSAVLLANDIAAIQSGNAWANIPDPSSSPPPSFVTPGPIFSTPVTKPNTPTALATMTSSPFPKMAPWYTALVTVSAAASGYHGYKRNNSIGWALVWGFFGGLAPVFTPAIALAQGFGKSSK